MKDEMHSGDADMSSLLHKWQVTPPLPPRFKEQVWQRIERSQVVAVSPWTVLRAWLAQTFARPAMAFSYVAVLLVAGLTIGFWQGRLNSERTTAELGARYVQMMSSFESTH